MSTRYLVLRADAPLQWFFKRNPFGTLSGHGVPDCGDSGAFKWAEREVGLDVEVTQAKAENLDEIRQDPTCAAIVEADALLAPIEPKVVAAEDFVVLEQAGDLRISEGLRAVGADTSPFTGQGVTAAVLDSGIDLAHPAFGGKEIIKCNFADQGAGSDDVSDATGHGTHCAATLCGNVVDGIRIGVAPGITRLCVGKVLGKSGCTLEALVRSMFWAVVEKKASVVSMSLEYDLPGNAKRLIERGVDAAVATNAAMRQQSEIAKAISLLRMFLELQPHSAIFAAATGNESARPRFALDAGLPAAELFAVGAVKRVSGQTGDQWTVAEFSNGRAQVVAPGVNVVSAKVGGGYVGMSGTSMATPHVAGVAALWLEKLRSEGDVMPDAVRSAVKAHANKKLLQNVERGAVGAGLVQAPQ